MELMAFVIFTVLASGYIYYRLTHMAPTPDTKKGIEQVVNTKMDPFIGELEDQTKQLDRIERKVANG